MKPITGQASNRQPEELAHVQNPQKDCENCGQRFTARNPNQKYCAPCQPIMKRQYDKNYYAGRGSYLRKRKRRKERAKRDSTPRPCATPGCKNLIIGTRRKKYCTKCIREHQRAYMRKYDATRFDVSASRNAAGAETRGDSAET